MPFLMPLIPIIAGVASIASTVIPLVTGGSGGGGGSAPSGTTSATNTSAQTQQDQRNRVASIAQRLPDLQSQLGGAVSPDFLMAMASMSSGNPGDRTDAEIAMQDWLGLGDTSGLFAGGGKPGLSSGGGGSNSSGLDAARPSGKSPFDMTDILSGLNSGGSNANDFVGGSV